MQKKNQKDLRCRLFFHTFLHKTSQTKNYNDRRQKKHQAVELWVCFTDSASLPPVYLFLITEFALLLCTSLIL